MGGKFIKSQVARREELEWGTLVWLSSPDATKARDLTVIEVTLHPGGGHDFHKHPNQEEALYVVDGEVEQWVETEKRLLGPGDSAFMGADVVHASFNISKENAKLLAVLGPCVGPEGYELVDVSREAPWATIR